MEGQELSLNDGKLECPSSPEFHGFGPTTFFPDRLIIETVGEGEEQTVVKVTRTKKKKVGRPEKGWDQQSISDRQNILDTPRRPQEPSQNSLLPSPGNPSSKALPKTMLGSKTRPKP